MEIGIRKDKEKEWERGYVAVVVGSIFLVDLKDSSYLGLRFGGIWERFINEIGIRYSLVNGCGGIERGIMVFLGILRKNYVKFIEKINKKK